MPRPEPLSGPEPVAPETPVTGVPAAPRKFGLMKTSFLSGIATVFKLLSVFAINKIIAMDAGPGGLAVIGQYQNFLALVMTFCTGAIDTGIVKYIAEYHDAPRERAKTIGNGLLITALCSVLIGALIFFYSAPLSQMLFQSGDYEMVLKCLAMVTPMCGLSLLFLSILNGHKAIRQYVLVQIVASLVGLAFTFLLSSRFHLQGVLMALTLSQMAVFFCALWVVCGQDWFREKLWRRGPDLATWRKLWQYSLMTATSAVTMPITQIWVRNHIIQNLSMMDAGYWQGVTKISDLYLLVITTSLSTYYLPRLAEIKDNHELRAEILHSCKIVLPLVLVSSAAIFIFRDLIISILFAPRFHSMKDLFLFQLVGDFFKICNWMLGYLLLAKAMTKCFVTIQLVFSALYVVMSVCLIDAFGLMGSTYAFALNHFLCLILGLWIFRDLLFPKPPQSLEKALPT